MESEKAAQPELRSWARQQRRSADFQPAVSPLGHYEQVDATKVKFVRPLKTREKQKFSYEVTTRHGANAVK